MAVGGTDYRESVAEDVADVEKAGWVQLDYRAVGVDPAIRAHVGNADLAVEAGAEVSAASCRALIGVAVEGKVGILGIARPCN